MLLQHRTELWHVQGNRPPLSKTPLHLPFRQVFLSFDHTQTTQNLSTQMIARISPLSIFSYRTVSFLTSKNKKSVGPDKIPSIVLKLTTNHFHLSFLNYQSLLLQCPSPRLIGSPKNLNPLNTDSSRPISIHSSAKIFERTIIDLYCDFNCTFPGYTLWRSHFLSLKPTIANVLIISNNLMAWSAARLHLELVFSPN